MSDPVVSVIIPAYNTAKTLPRALDSVFSQSERNASCEVIVVDDGSVDDITAALAPYRDRVRFFRQDNAGASAARNNGARQARGRYLAFLDADDFWHPRKLELQLAAFQERPEISLCWVRAARWSEAGPDALSDPPPDLSRAQYVSDFREIFMSPYFGTPGVMMPREVFEGLGGFREDLESAEDVDLWLRATYGKVAARIRAALFFVVTSDTSLTALQKDKAFKNNLRVIDDFCRGHPDFERRESAAVRHARAKVYENWGSAELLRGNTVLARSLLTRSMRNRANLRVLMLLSKALIAR
jgi:glycosyltransferase involved in cell wall biosynthesis